MANRTSVIPESAGQVRDKFLKFKPAGGSVEEARAAMIASQESAVTTRNGVAVPSFIKEAASRGQGGNVPSGRPANSQVAFLESAKAKIAALKVPQGRRVNLDAMVAHGYLLQAEADALLAESNGVTAPAEAPVVKIEDVTEPEVTPEPVAVAEPVIEQPVRVAVEPDAGQAKIVENSEFVGKIYRDGKEWVAEISYKNGAGTERFTANSKDDLMLKVLEGKGHGTVKVREVVKENKRRLLYGDENDTWDFFFDEVKASHNLTVEQYNALPAESRALIQDTIQAQQILAFQQDWPEYYATARNFEKIGKYLNKRGWPLTRRNLELAYKDLTADEELDLRPVLSVAKVDAAPAAPEPVQSVATVVEDSTPAPAAPAAPAPAPVVRKRGTTGLIPGSSSVSSVDGAPKAEDGNKSRELSVSELRAMPIADLKRIAVKDRKYGTRY
jgi:hypothetical protein